MAQTGTTALKEFGDCLSSREPRLLDLPSGFPMPADPVAWAHDVLSAHPAKLRLEAMPRTVGVRVDDPSKALSLGQDAAPEQVRKMLTGISRGAAAHVAMELWHADSFGELVADPAAEPFKEFMTKALAWHEPFMREIVTNFDNEWVMSSEDIDTALANIAGEAER